jgi:DNA-binding NarL/FixJ family response regulator
MPTGPTRVLAVDDDDGFRATLRELVDATADFELVGEAASGEQGVQLASELSPEIVLLDVNMPGMGGPAAAREITQASPSSVVALISGHATTDLPADSWSCGADAVMTKDALRPAVLLRLRDQVRPAGQG